ncbi:hypothetical protein Tco_1009783 [Tanacetum coccineum]
MATPMAEDTTFKDDQFAFMSTEDIQRTSFLLDNEISILKEELQRTNLELDSFKEKIKLNKQFPYWLAILLKNSLEFKLIRDCILMVDSITFGQEMVNILVSGEEYDKVFNHLDMLNAPLEDFTTANVVAWHGTRIEGFIVLKKYQQVHGDLKLRGRLESVSFMEDQI